MQIKTTGAAHMRTFTILSAIATIAMGTIGGRKLNAATVTRLAVDLDGEEIDMSVKHGPYSDGKVEVIGAFNYDADTFFVRVQKIPGMEVTQRFQRRVAGIVDAFLTDNKVEGKWKVKADRFDTVAVADLGRGIQDWTTMMVKRLDEGRYQILNLGRIDIEKLEDDKYAMAYEGFANIVDGPELMQLIENTLTDGGHQLANVLQKGVELPVNTFLARAPKGCGIHATNGFQSYLYDKDLTLLDDKKIDDQVDTVGAPILAIPAINEFGELIDGKFTGVSGSNQDWDVFTGDRDDFAKHGWSTQAVDKMAQAAA